MKKLYRAIPNTVLTHKTAWKYSSVWLTSTQQTYNRSMFCPPWASKSYLIQIAWGCYIQTMWCVTESSRKKPCASSAVTSWIGPTCGSKPFIYLDTGRSQAQEIKLFIPLIVMRKHLRSWRLVWKIAWTLFTLVDNNIGIVKRWSVSETPRLSVNAVDSNPHWGGSKRISIST